jgi:hypothetical protein
MSYQLIRKHRQYIIFRMQVENVIDDIGGVITTVSKDLVYLVQVLTTRGSNGCMPFNLVCNVIYFYPYLIFATFLYVVCVFCMWWFSGINKVVQLLEKLQADVDMLQSNHKHSVVTEMEGIAIRRSSCRGRDGK